MDDRVATALCVLGSLEVVRDGEPVRLGSSQQRRVLAVLVVHANEVVSSDRLVDVLWGEDPPRSATHTLQTLLSRLRATLGDDRLESCPPGYQLRVASGAVDASRFEELVRMGLGESERAAVALGVFDEALSLWRGSPYAEFASEEFAVAEVARLVELRARAIEERAAALLDLDRPAEVIGELKAQIAVEPFRERLRELLMLALARAGRPVESLRAYDAFRRFLADEVGVVPSPGLQELNDDIVRQHPDVSWAGSPRREPGPSDLPGNLPRQMTAFVGREAEIASVAELVGRSSLVTLTGVGGVGKTRLALQVAARAVAEFPDGAWFCEFASVTDSTAVWETVATTLRVQPLPGLALDESVLDYLAAKRLLLVLDNCEHLLDAVARLVDAIEHRCARVSMLATSREGLALAGERLVAVPSLGVPAEDAEGDDVRRAEAVRLFWDRASAVKSDFELTDHNVGAVGVLCRRLDGIPLAIELAAARVRSLSPEDLVSRLDQRFKLLTHGSRAAMERHQTLRSTIDWSYDLLTPLERRGLQCLSVFVGGCDLAAAEAVLPGDEFDVLDVVDVLGQLVDKSLVVADDTDDRVRYRLLETIRQYARERLDAGGDPGALRRRHADHYLALAEAAGPHLRGRDHLEWTSIVMRDIDNFRVVLDWAVETSSKEHALRLVAALAVQGRIGDTAMDWATTATAIPGEDDHPLVPAAAAWAAWGATMGHDYARAEELIAIAERVQDVLDTRDPQVARARAILAFYAGDFDESRRRAEHWVELARAANDPYELAHALVMLGSALQFIEPNGVVGVLVVEEGVRVAREEGIDSALSTGLMFIAGFLPYEESERALALLDEAIAVGIRIDERLSAAKAVYMKAWIAAQRSEWSVALQVSADSAEQLVQLGDFVSVDSNFALGGVALCQFGSFEPAAVLIGVAEAILARRGPDVWLEMLAATDVALREALGEQQVATLTARGAALDITDAVAYLRAEADGALAAP